MAVKASYMTLRWGRFVTIAVIIAALFGAAQVISAIDRHALNDPYCESIDPTDCSVEVNIYNDMALPYVIKQCSGSFRTPSCKAYAYVVTLQPGQNQKASGTSQNAPPQPWLVLAQDGKIAGCLNLQFTKYAHSPVTMPLSKLVSCKPYL